MLYISSGTWKSLFVFDAQSLSLCFPTPSERKEETPCCFGYKVKRKEKQKTGLIASSLFFLSRGSNSQDLRDDNTFSPVVKKKKKTTVRVKSLK